MPDDFEVVKVLNGTWNVRDNLTGEWVAMWLTKLKAQGIADRLNAERRKDSRP
ncbi:MAG TPA: hypothetical protein VNC18_07375 [Gemmatimonadaceae bacterium]|jgi:hypothetical protein|nr:hypothetical protein [Gemmatimonadaceae bacterium]